MVLISTRFVNSAVVRIQMLSELEEIISYKEATAVGNNERRAVIQKTWMKRQVHSSHFELLRFHLLIASFRFI